MTWASERRLVVFIVLGAIALAFGAVVFIAVFYHTPTCSDTIQNQDEEGIDCGGSCPYLCNTALEPPTVLFTQAVPNGAGRTDIIALVENKNARAAAKDVPYTITAYGYDQSLIRRVTGTLDLPPSATVPVFVPGVSSGSQTVQSAFLSTDDADTHWYTLQNDPRILPRVSNTALGGMTDAPRVTAVLSNPDAFPMTNVKLIALVRDASGNAIGASQTLLERIPPQGQAVATLTWNAAFAGIPVSVQVFPLISLP